MVLLRTFLATLLTSTVPSNEIPLTNINNGGRAAGLLALGWRFRLTLADALAIHADLIPRHGGSPGLRDARLLEAALFRPQTGYCVGLIEEAAALGESQGQNHAFVDGNKRIAFAATYTFLAINGITLRASADEAHAFINGLHEVGSFRFEELANGFAQTPRNSRCCVFVEHYVAGLTAGAVKGDGRSGQRPKVDPRGPVAIALAGCHPPVHFPV